MKRRLLILAGAVAAAVAFAVPQANAQQICYDLDVTVAGTTLADQAGCLPE